MPSPTVAPPSTTPTVSPNIEPWPQRYTDPELHTPLQQLEGENNEDIR
jgi:hypothetical protein